MARATQFCVNLENKPGMLAKLGAALQRAKVNIQAISVVDNVDCGMVRFVAAPAAKAKAALKRAKMPFCQQTVIAAKLPNLPGELAKASAKLARAKVNIHYVYGSTGVAGQSAMVVFSVDNLAKAATVLK